MKLSLLLCALVLSIPGWCASGTPAALRPEVVSINYPIIGKDSSSKELNKRPQERKLYYKGKGTMGLILGLTLGPVGYGIVHLFSHNQTMRKKAGTGMMAWISVVAVTAIVWGCIAQKVSLDDILLAFLQGLAEAY